MFLGLAIVGAQTLKNMGQGHSVWVSWKVAGRHKVILENEGSNLQAAPPRSTMNQRGGGYKAKDL